ncbi:MAG: hypothetical protein J6J43_02490 [Oscillospiraceae bacterium]|nr:hypothetical protein [Oscillospiraceae bacterium]
MHRAIGERQRWAWLAAGTSAVVAAQLSGLQWLWVLLGGGVVTAYYLYIDKQLGCEGLADRLSSVFGFSGKVIAVLFLFWLILTMGRCACLADLAFPTVDGFPGLGWVLLALAAWGSRKGSAACAGCGGVLCLFLLALYALIAAFAAPNVQLEYLRPSADYKQGICALGLLLVPAVVWCIPVKEQKGSCRKLFLLLPVAAAGLCAVTSGVLSPELAKTRAVPVYDLARSVSILGVVERIEPLLSAAMTMGIFCLLSALASACRVLADQLGQWQWSGSLCCLAAGAAMYPVKTLPQDLFIAGNTIFFLILPAVIVMAQKKLKK